MMKTILAGYQKVKYRIGWEDYASKIDQSTRDTIAYLLGECRRNGFFNPVIVGDKIVFHQLVEGEYPIREQMTLCSLCERKCPKKNFKGMFEQGADGNEVKKCWE